MSQEPVWYVYQETKQLGPFTLEQIKEQHHSSMISQASYLFKVGWKDWKLLIDCFDELGIAQPHQAPQFIPDNRFAPRATVGGQIIVHNVEGDIIFATGANISATGIFIETSKNNFKVSDILKLTCKIKSENFIFNAKAKVVRFVGVDQQFPGYGLQFLDLEPNIVQKLNLIVAQLNSKQAEANHGK